MSRLLDRRLLVVTGKGGVGRSTVSAALGLASAKAGLRTLLCEVNSEDRLSALLGHGGVGPEVRQLEDGLFGVDIRPAEAMREYVLMKIKLERVYRAVFENRLVKYFLRFIPSLAELVMVGKILHHVREERKGRPVWDRVIVDAPATGHALTFLAVPQVVLDTVPPGPMASEALWMRDLLVDPSVTGALLVSLPEELPVKETLELGRALRDRLHIGTLAVILNQAVEPRFTGRDLEELAATPLLRNLAAEQASGADRTRAATEALAALALPVLPLPTLFVPRVDREALEGLAPLLAARLGGLGR